jgi:hypothetical protein
MSEVYKAFLKARADCKALFPQGIHSVDLITLQSFKDGLASRRAVNDTDVMLGLADIFEITLTPTDIRLLMFKFSLLRDMQGSAPDHPTSPHRQRPARGEANP